MKNELQTFQDNNKKSLSTYAIRRYDQNAFWSSVKICIMENKNLQLALKTPQGQTSLYAALRHAATTGLSLNPRDGEACLIAYEGKNGIVVNYQPMKNGYIRLALESGKVEDIIGTAVREGDIFEIEQSGQTDKYTLKKDRKNRGKIDGYMVAVKFKNGVIRCEYMTHQEVQEHKKKYGQGLDKNDSAWNKSEEGMSVKTVVKKLLTTLKISRALDSLVEIDNINENPRDERDITPEPGMSAAELSEKLDEPEKKPIEAKPDQKTEKKEKDIF